uniref:Putative leucine-rich repeat domain, L domain-like protein n=1 Tax=Helianthus annuus TaxID=4232 RepID=A0A251UV66_HELAN
MSCYFYIALASFHHLEVLDLEDNHFVGNIPSTIKALSSLKVISLAYNNLNGSLDHGLCELKNLQELNLKDNMFTGKLPECFNMLSSLKFLDISSNQFIGTLPPSLIANLTSLEYVDFSHNKFVGSFSFSSFSNLKNLEVVGFISDNDKFEVETEEPRGWNPMFQLKGLALSNCNINMHKGSVVPSFLLQQHRLKKLDMSHNSMEGDIPTWLMKNNTMLEFLSLMNNSFGGVFSKPFYRNPNTRWLDMSGNLMKGAIPKEIQKSLPSITRLNLSGNYLEGPIPSLIGDLSELETLDLSQNRFSGEVPLGLFTNLTRLEVLKLSNNIFHGEVLSGNLSFKLRLSILHLDGNYFSGKIGDLDDKRSILSGPSLLDISNNFFTGSIPGWISNMSYESELVVRNNRLGGQFPCGTNSFTFLDISQNHFSGSIPSCLVSESLKHLHLGSNAFTGSIPNSFCNLTNILTLDIGNNRLFGRIPKFLGELSNIRILLLGKNEFSGNIPKQLCQLTNVSLLDLSSNFLSGSIPGCLQNINRPSYQAFTAVDQFHGTGSGYSYRNPRNSWFSIIDHPYEVSGTQDEVLFTTKTLSYAYKGNVLDIMSGLDLSCNKLIGYIPEELGLLTGIHVLNLSHNKLIGPIPVNFSSLANIESLDLSFNSLSGNIPQELIKLNALAIFNVSYNNLSGRLPEMKAQFSTFNKESYKGNPLLCGLPLENKCTIQSLIIQPTNEERSHEKWYNMDMASFYGSFGSTWFVFILGFIALLCVNPYWKRRWLDFVEECLCELKNLQELNLKDNMFTGKLPECFNMLSSLKFLDISSNQFIGTLPPSLIANLTSLEYVDFSHNKFEGSFSFSSFSNLKNLEVVGFISDNDKFEVETEEPRGWNPMFQLKGLALSNCNINMHKGSVVPSFLLQQHRLKKLDMSHNSMEGDIPTCTFNKESYKGNPLLCGPPLENQCTIQSLMIQPTNEERSHEKWYNMDMASFYGSFGSTWFVFILGFIALLCVNPYWKRRWLDFVEECMYTCYYFLCDLVWKIL